MGGSTEGAIVTIELGEEELLGAHLVAKMEGIAHDDPGAFDGLLRATLRHGLEARMGAAGMRWPPTADDLELADTVAREMATERAPADEPPTPGLPQWALLTAGTLTAALIVLLIGGYGLKWSWTGFAGNNQVWDWMQLLLLPIALATFPLWLRFSSYMSTARRRSIGIAVAAFGVFVLVGYVNPLRWTGFRGHSLWDWMTLLILPVSIVAVRAWPQSGRDVRRRHIVGAALVGVALIVTIIGGYGAGWSWTGFKGNTLWDWLTLALGPVAVTTLLVPPLVRLMTGRVDERAEHDRFRKAREGALHDARARIESPR